MGVDQWAAYGLRGNSATSTRPHPAGTALPEVTGSVNIDVQQHPGVSVVKTFTSPPVPFVPVENNRRTYTMRVTNTGNTNLTVIQLADTYDTTFWEYVSATPVPDDTTAGNIQWNNLVPVTPLPPQGFLDVTITLKARQSGATPSTDDTATVAASDDQGHKQALIKNYSFENIIGHSSPMLKVFDLIRQVAKWNTTVLIRGESGTGKEVVANAIHFNSGCASGPFLKLNCAALPDTLLESELFGHEKGAFSGAISQRKGRFELADNGTLFLDEIGEISASFQAKLLRVLQEGEFERVGGTHTIKVNVRIIAATNRNLEEEVTEGKFREDLYYRLNVMPILMPALRDRTEDIPELSEFLLGRISAAARRAASGNQGKRHPDIDEARLARQCPRTGKPPGTGGNHEP